MTGTAETWSRFAVAAALGLAVVLGAPRVHASDEVDATSLRVEALAAEAFARAERGAYKEAVELYLQANEASPAAVLAFDIAWLYDKHLGSPALALDYYRRAVAGPDVTPDLSGRAQARIQALSAVATVATPPPKAAKTEGNAQGSVPWSPLQTSAIVAAGTGLAALGVGVVFAIVAKTKDDEAGRYCDGDRCIDARAITLTEEAKRAATVADVAFVAAAACIATGVTLWLVAPRRASVGVGIRAASGGAPSLVFGGTLR